MASIIEGYSYDIFISYRQKDNNYDGWVTEFVGNLKKELEATFKEEVNVYFDINPHDGILETHDVDASLKEKLKCLIFIPIISQTYCDSKSFAWQHEFCSFNNQVKDDKFGREITLVSGNVSSRILPVKIHDLDAEDRKLLENELGGVLRSIEFIYKSPGVNRPLRANEDHPQDNLNKTYYRDQINKVANSVKEIITALKKQSLQPEEVSKQNSGLKLTYNKNLKNRIYTGFLILLVLIVLGFLFIPKLLRSGKELEKSIAVLPFINDSPDQENAYFINGIMDEILNNLQKIKDFRVLSRTSVEQYRGSTKPSIPKIAKTLDVNYIIEGSGQKYGNKFILRVQLIAASNERHLWGESYEKEILETNDIINTQSQIAKAIAEELKVLITTEEKTLIENIPTHNLDALFYYQKGREELRKYTSERTSRLNKASQITNRQVLATAEKLFIKALEIDTAFAQAYSGLARVYWTWSIKEDSVLFFAEKALSFDSQLPEAYFIRGVYYWNKGDNDKANSEFDKALALNPNFWEAYFYKGRTYESKDLLKAINNLQKASTLNSGSELADIKYQIARIYRYAGFFEKSKKIALDILRLDDDSVRYYVMVGTAEYCAGNKEKALELRKRAYSIDSTNLSTLQGLTESYRDMHRWDEMLKYARKLSSREISGYNNLGYAYLKTGYKKEAEACFDILMKNNINEIKANPRSYNSYYNLAFLYAIKGENEKVIENLNSFNQIEILNIHALQALNLSAFDSIRNESEFKKIANEMNAKFQAEHERIRKWLE